MTGHSQEILSYSNKFNKPTVDVYSHSGPLVLLVPVALSQETCKGSTAIDVNLPVFPWLFKFFIHSSLLSLYLSLRTSETKS